MEFPKILKMLREKRGYSQKQLADVLHVSKNSVSHYELGSCMPSIDVIINMADIFDVSLIICFEEAMQTYQNICWTNLLAVILQQAIY